MRAAFALLSLTLVALLGATVFREDRAEWKKYQSRFHELVASREKDPAKARTIRATSPAIHQIYNPEIGVVDRCPTCHLGIDDPAFAKAKQPFATHPPGYLDRHPPDRVGCVLCHDGQGLATTVAGAHGRVPHWNRPLLEGAARESACARCHAGATVPKAPVLSQGMRLIDQAACVACHDISEVPAREHVGPDLSRIGDKVDPQWLLRWLSDPHGYLARTMMPNFRLSPRDAAAIAAFLLAQKGGPLAPAPEPPRTAGASLELGEAVFKRSACTSCHPVAGKGGHDGRLGPDLAHIGDKVSREWLATWLRDPRRLQPHSRMSAFSFTEEDLGALVAYLTRALTTPVSERRRPSRALPAAMGSEREIARGRSLVVELGCLGCHPIEGLGAPAKAGPDLSRVGEKRVEELDFGHTTGVPRTLAGYLERKILDPRAFGAGLKMPYFGFTQEEADAMTVALLSFQRSPLPRHYRAEKPEPVGPPLPEGPAGVVARRYQCFTCHALGGRGGTMAPDLAEEGSKVKGEWLRRYFAEPTHIRPEVKESMPHLGITPAEVDTIAAWIALACVSDRVPPDPLGGRAPDAALVEQGRAAFDEYGCAECHKPGGDGPDLAQVGARLEPGWIYALVQEPDAFVRGISMPDLDLGSDEALAITAYLASQR
ncbi:MAG: c-type cytochrome [Myxococcota bacterium]